MLGDGPYNFMSSISQEKKQPDIYYKVQVAMNFSYGSHIFVTLFSLMIAIAMQLPSIIQKNKQNYFKTNVNTM